MANKVLGFTIQIQGTEAAINNATDLRLAISEINKQLKTTTDPQQYKRLERELVRLKGSQKEVNAQLRDQVRQQQASLEVTADNVGAYRRLSAQLGVARARYKDLAAAGKENTEEAKNFRQEAERLDKQLKQIDADVGQFQRNVGDYRNAIRDSIPFLGEFEQGLENIGTATSRTGKLIATSFFIFSLVNQLAQGIQALKEFAEEFRQFRGFIETSTGALGDELDEAASRAQAIANTYKEDAQEIILAANTISKEFNIGLGDALDRIEVGFRAGANASGELLSSLREYSSQVDDVDQLFQVLIRAQQEGIYSDKGIDAIKEFNIRIREQTTATRDALVNAFGEEFTNRLFDNINSGAISTVEALQQVSDGLNAAGLTAQQQQQVIADVFGGPGEDAGIRFLQLLGDIDGELENVVDITSEYSEQQRELFEANLELTEAQNEVAKALSDTGVEFDVLRTRAQAFLLRVAADVLEFIDQFPATLSGIRAAARQFLENIVGTFQQAGRQFELLQLRVERFNPFGRGAEAVERDIARIQSQIQEYRETGLSVGEAYRDAFLSKLSEIENENTAQRIIGEQRQQQAARGSAIEAAEGIAKTEKDITAEKTRQREEEKKLRELQRARRQELEALLIQNRLATTLAVARTEKNFQFVEQTGDQIEKALLEARNNLDGLFDEAAKNAKEKLEQVRESVVSIADQIQSNVSFAAGALNELFQQQAERAEETFNRRIQQQEEELEVTREKLQTATGLRKQELKKQLRDQEQALDTQNRNREQAAREFAKKEKAVSIIQSIVNTAVGVTKALASLPFPANLAAAITTGIQGGIQTALIAAQPLARGGIAMPVALADGRITAVPNIAPLRNGDNILATVRRGEVILNQQQQDALGGAATFATIGVPGFQEGGFTGAPITAPRVDIPGVGLSRQLEQAIVSLDRKTDAINGRMDRLRAFVVSDDVADDLATRDSLRVDATLE